MTSPKRPDWLDLKEWNSASDPHWSRRSIAAFDLDDTLTAHGELPSAAHAALEATARKGWRLVLVTDGTGRCRHGHPTLTPLPRG